MRLILRTAGLILLGAVSWCQAGESIPADTAPLPAGERLTWGEEAASAASSVRSEIVLNGLWQFVPNQGERATPPTGDWGWMRVPGSWRAYGWPPVFPGLVARGTGPAWQGIDRDTTITAGWYQRPLRIPADWADRRVVLDLERVSTDATVYLDGKAVGNASWPGGRIDLTAAVRPGTEQRLAILVLATAGAGEFAQFMGTATEQVTKTKAETRSRGLIGDVVLTALPKGPEISEVFVQPTVEGGTRMDLEVGLDGAPSAGAATLVAKLCDATGSAVASFEAPVGLTAAPTQLVRAGWAVPNVRLWDLGQPNLYTVEVSVRGAGIADSHRVRFGFRQFRIDGRRCLLNGSEIRLRPNLANGALWFAAEVREHIAARSRQGYNFTELWPGSVQRRGSDDYQGVVARVADEEGWLISGMLPHLGDFISGSGLDAAGLAEALRPYRRLRNHPSIILWGSSGNYFGHNTDQDPRKLGRRGFADQDADYRKRAAAGNQGLALYRAMDPTRPQFTHHGGDVGDIHTCNNYLNLMPLQEREEWLSQWNRDGTMPFWPVEFETPMNLSLHRDRNNHFNADTSEPLLSEYCAGVLGEQAYAQEPAEYRAQMVSGYEGKDRWRFRSVGMATAPAFQTLQVINQRALWRSWRTLGSTILPLPWHDGFAQKTVGRAPSQAEGFVPGSRGPWQPTRQLDQREDLPAAAALGAFDPMGAGGPTLAYIAGAAGDDIAALVAKDHHVPAGAMVRKTILVINDERGPRPWTAVWKAVSDGRTIAEGSAQGALPPAGRAETPIAFATSAVAARTTVTIELAATVGGRKHSDRFVVQVYPAPAIPPLAVLTADPEGATTAALAEVGVGAAPWDGRPAAGRVVVIGRRALARAEVRALDLGAHLAAGGRVLVMAQERGWYEQGQGLRTSGWSSRAIFPVPTMQRHPVIAGLDAEDLRDWNGAGSGVPAYPAPVYEKEAHGYPRHGWKWGNAGTVCGLAIEKPHHGAWRPLLQCEFDLAFSPLLELPAGPGLLVWSTLDLEGRSRPDPVAQLILRRLVERAAGYAGEPARRETVMLGTAALAADLGLIGATAQTLPGDLRPVLVAADARIADAELLAWIARGGRALVLVSAQAPRLGFTVAAAERHLGSLVPPAWPECLGLAASDLRLRNQVDVAILSAAPAGGEIAADGLLGRLAVGQGVAIVTTIDPRALPAEAQPWLRFSQWRWTRSLAQLAGNLGMLARGDGKALLADLGRDAPRRLVGTWLMKAERPLPPTGKPWDDTPAVPVAMATEDAAAWWPMPVPGAWERNPPLFNGSIWVRRHVDIPADWAGCKLVVDLGPIDDHDQVWFQGRRIGGMGKENPDAWQTARSYSIPPEAVAAGPAVIAVRVFDWFGNGGFSAKAPADMRLRRADGQGAAVPLGGPWLARIERSYPPAKSPGDLLDPGIDTAAQRWHEPACADADWQTILLPRMFQDAFADIDGAVWLRRTIEVPPHWIGRDLQLNLGRIADADVVFADGVEIGRGSGPGERSYRIPQAQAQDGRIAIAVRVFNRQGPGGFLGTADDLALALPGDIAGAPWYCRGYRTDFSTGDDPFRYYRW
jgi:beta-galactosidase